MAIVRSRKPCRDSEARSAATRRRRCTYYGAHAVRCASGGAPPPPVHVVVRAEVDWVAGCGSEGQGQGRGGQRPTPPPEQPGAGASLSGAGHRSCLARRALTDPSPNPRAPEGPPWRVVKLGTRHAGRMAARRRCVCCRSSCGVLMMPDNNPYPQPPPVRPQPSVPPRMAARACLQTPSRMPLGFTVAQVHTSTPSISCALSSAILAGTLTCAARHTHRGCPAASSYACATSCVPGISLCRGPRCRRTSVSSELRS